MHAMHPGYDVVSQDGRHVRASRKSRVTRLSWTIRACAGGLHAEARSVWAKRERLVALPLVLVVAVVQSRSPAVADIIGARRACTAMMISSGSIPCR
jgi:hypothetical protein